jgi:hypothetical protein
MKPSKVEISIDALVNRRISAGFFSKPSTLSGFLLSGDQAFPGQIRVNLLGREVDHIFRQLVEPVTLPGLVVHLGKQKPSHPGRSRQDDRTRAFRFS